MRKTPEEEREEIRRLVIEGRRRQGLPPTIQDPAFLSRLAAILVDDLEPPEQSP